MTALSRVREGARRGDLAAIHVAKKQLQLNDDEYRDVMATVCGGVRSAADLDFGGRQRFRAHLEACLRERTPPRTLRDPLTPEQSKMWSLWMSLVDKGLAHNRSMKAIESFARRQTGVERLGWLTPQQQELVIESLKQWLKRGVAPRSEAGQAAGVE